MKKIIAGILAILCVMGSVNMNFAKSGNTKGSTQTITAYAATTEVPAPGKNASKYSYKYADSSRYTTKFTTIDVLTDPTNKRSAIYDGWKSEDGKYTYGLYQVDIIPKGEVEPEYTEYVVGISKANENVIDVDLSGKLEKDGTVQEFLNYNSIKVEWKVSYLSPKTFANSYLKTINLDGVKYIGDNTFEKCAYITDMEIPESVLYVGSNVFANSGLKTLAVKNEMPVVPVNMCSGTKLTKIDFAHPELIRTIDKGAFQGSSVPAPLFMTSYASNVSKYEYLTVGENAYADCTSIRNIDVPENVVTLGIGSFSGCTSISALRCGDGLLGIDKEAFKGCSAMNDVTFNDKLIAIGGGAFQGCRALKKVSGIPETIGDWVVTEEKTGAGYGFGDGVFSGCTSLTQCDLPESITILPKSTFEGCSALTTLGFNSGSGGKNLLVIGESAFAKCTSLLEAKFDNVTIIGPSAYSGCTKLQEASFPKAEYIGASKDTKSDIADAIVETEFDRVNSTIKNGGNTFLDCTSLKSVKIPKSRYIFPASFKNCSAMTELTTGVCEIVGNYALDGCTSMKEITLLSKQYGNSAPTKSNKKDGFIFQNCTAAEKITIDAEFLVEFPNKTPNGFFNGCSALKTIETKNGDFSKVSIVSNKTFAGCSSIKEFNFNEVLIVEDEAFADCTSLKKISSGEDPLQAEDYGNNCFLNCPELKVDVTGKISTIGDNAFKNSGITSVDLQGMQGGTVVIGNNSFAGCPNLATVKILSDNAAKFSIGNGVFSDCATLKDVIYDGKIITTSMFKNCPSLEYITTNAKNIKANAFDGDTSLKMVKDMGDIKGSTIIADEINGYAFRDCASLEVIPADENTVLSGVGIFANCATIKDVEVGMLTNSIFAGCTSLDNVKMTGIVEIPDSAFTGCTSLKKINIAEMVNIGPNAFSGSGLESVKINNAQTINLNAFANCNSLKDIDIVATTIGSKAFYKCEFLVDAELNVDKVQANAFEGCASLRNVTFQSSDSHSLTELGSSAFNDCGVLYELILQGDPKMSSKCVGYASKRVNADFILVGETGSTVEAYAKANNIEFCDIKDFDLTARKLARNVPGDIDGNTIISVADAIKLQSWLLNKSTPGIIGANMDVNGDKKVDAFDMIAMRKKLLKK